MKKYSFLIICTLLTGLLFTTCEPWIVPEAVFVNFNANGGQGDMKALRFMDGEEQSLTKNTYTRNGYNFDGWNTRSDGRGQRYADRQNVSITKSVTLYAQWKHSRGKENGHEWVDLGLPSGIKWATCNVGATTPEGYGDYFAWGEIAPKYDYSWETYKYCNGSETSLTKYCDNSSYGYNGFTDNKTTLDLSDDAARANWGGKWRMPTNSEVIELIDNCSWTWTTQNGVSGYKVTSKTNGNSIFLPVAGYRDGTSIYSVYSYGCYWSSSLRESSPHTASYLNFNLGNVGKTNNYRDYGRTVRAVFSENDTPSTFVTLSFDANGGEGTMPAQTFEAGVSQAIAANTFTRDGYAFAGWNTKADGSGTSYTDKQSITLTNGMTLYAQWSGTENGYQWVDLGLPSGLKWATCNVGATSPEGYGDYFAWGETEPKSNYDWSTYKYCNGSSSTLTKYNTDSSRGSVDNKTTLELIDDAARVNWGGKWRMPTQAEQEELINNCTWTLTTQNGVIGYKVTSKTNGNSIFLPAAGYRDGTSFYGGSYGYSWSSSLDESYPYRACELFFDLVSGYVDWSYSTRDDGNTVRAVFSENDTPSTFVTLSFNANGGSGTMTAQTFEAGVSQTLAANAFTRSGYTFTGWNTNADGSGTAYTDQQEITLSEDLTLYAQWKQEQVVSGSENGYDYVDLGLPSGLKWATCNVGATAPEGYGDYFAWGETNPKDKYNWSTYKYCNGSETSLTKYNTNSNFGTVDNKTTLELSDDAARVNWGGSWRMPTRAEQDELRNNCTWTWTTQSGVNGYKVTSKTNGNSIFLPATGYRVYTSVYDVGSVGHVWSSSLVESYPSLAYELHFHSGNVDRNSYHRYLGHTVRAVFSENDTPSTFVTLSFDANGGSGTMTAQTFEAGVSQAIAANAFTRSGYTFTGWNTNADGSGTSYTDKQSITISQDMTLYAQWESASGSGGGSSTSGTENGHDYVDLGLPSGLKWATCNVGATAPEGYGDYFAWGETAPKDNYDWSTYKYGPIDAIIKYCTQSSLGYNGFTDNKTTLDLSDDAARTNWGGKWRMPTTAEQDELINNCTWTWTTKNGVNGYKVTSKTNGNSIFLPAAGYRSGSSVYRVGSYGYYWSSSLYESNPCHAYYLGIYSGDVDWSYDGRYYGHTVRAVCP